MDLEGQPPCYLDDGCDGAYGLIDMLTFRWVLRFF